MSKYQKALEWYKGNKGWIDHYEFPEEHQKVFEELLQKATPMEHKYLTDQECKKCGGNGLYLEDYEYDELTYIEGRDYCPNCGQKIDWTDID